jgi:alpha-L-fucosidase
VGEFVEAAKAEGLKVGLYWSLMDWSHPECLPEERMKYWDGGQIHQFGFKPPFKITPRFYRYLKTQMTELLTQYGKIDVLWHDGTWGYDAPGWRIADLNRAALKLQPHILFTDRAHRKEDIASCEQHIQASDSAWEACMTLNDNWGYCATDTNWKDPFQVVSMLLQIAQNQGCLLLNVGPRPDGAIPTDSVKILKAVGKWTHTYAEALYKIQRSPFSWSNVFHTTVSGRRLYLHVKNWPGRELRFGGLATRIRSAKLLPNGKALPVEQTGDVFVVKGLPAKSPDPIMSVIRIDCAGPILAC